jgi:hypothetical protein
MPHQFGKPRLAYMRRPHQHQAGLCMIDKIAIVLITLSTSAVAVWARF